MNILVVDDNPEIVELLTVLLPRAEVTDTGCNGREAVAAVRKAFERGAPYDLICLDIMMPKMDGRQALREIRAEEAERGIDLGDGAKVVMVTALADCENVFGSFHRDGCDGYIVKPFERDQIWETLERLDLV
ncbi:MAG: response regulator [Planctomycetota bacterium]|jgi:two-component system chemotaxis response regulator CheY